MRGFVNKLTELPGEVQKAWLMILKKHKPAAMLRVDLMTLAEKEGFEPPVPWIKDNGFQDRRIRPLCHFSLSFKDCPEYLPNVLFYGVFLPNQPQR